MPTAVPIEVFRIGHTVVDDDEVDRWMSFLGVTDPEAILDDMGDQELSSPAALIALSGKRCYMSFQEGLNPNVTKIRKRYTEYFDNILKSRHGSVLEHSVFNFAIENVSRVFTAEMNRHRAGWAISEGSLRFIRFGDNIPYWEPDSIKGDPRLADDDVDVVLNRLMSGEERTLDGAAWDAGDEMGLSASRMDPVEVKKQLTRRAFHRAFQGQQDWYRVLEVIWADELSPESKFKDKKQITSMMRRIIGLGVATGGVWSGNVRALRHVIAMRASEAAEEEMLHVFSRVAKLMRDKEPMMFGDFTETPEGYWVPKYEKV